MSNALAQYKETELVRTGVSIPRGLLSRFDEIIIIKSCIHIPLDYHNHLEVILLRGEGKDVGALTGRIMSVKGVRHVKLNITPLKLKLLLRKGLR